MEKPFHLISGKVARRSEFDMTAGTQPTWALFYIKEGSFELDFGTGPQRITAGDIVIFNDTTNFLRQVISPLVFVYIQFRVNFRCPFGLNLPMGKITLEDTARFISTVRIYERIIESEDRRMEYYREHLLEDMLMQIYAEHEQLAAEEKSDCDDDPLICAAANFILNSLDKKLSIEDVCRAAGTNPSTLNWRFRRARNISVGAYIISERMKLAKRLLRSTNYSTDHIALKCGYENVYYFSNAFKKSVGTSPSRYRDLYR